MAYKLRIVLSAFKIVFFPRNALKVRNGRQRKQGRVVVWSVCSSVRLLVTDVLWL